MVTVIIAIISMLGKGSTKRAQALVDEITSESPFRKQQVGPRLPHNDLRARDKEREIKQAKEKAKEALSSNVSIYDPQGLLKEREAQENQIVGLAEAKGFWSCFVMSRSLTFIKARMSANREGKGFWVKLIDAQSTGQSRSQGRGR